MTQFKIKKILSMLPAALLAILATGCGYNDVYIDGNNGGGGGTPEVPEIINGEMRDYPVWGTVTDNSGNPLQGVTVTSGDQSATSDQQGFFSLDRVDVNNDVVLVKFTKEDYFPVVRTGYYSEEPNQGWEVAMNSLYGESTDHITFHSDNKAELMAGGMTVELPRNGFMVAATGEHYTGNVNASLYYLSPETENFSNLMPGSDLAAIDGNGNRRKLLSFGMANVLLTAEDGNRLQLAEGKNATITYPMPTSLEENAKESIPLWTFSESKGMWIEQGVATKDSEGRYSGEVSHFSWSNIDTPEEEAWIEGYVTNDDGVPLNGLRVYFANQTYATTDINGHYRHLVLANNVFNVKVPSKYYGNYSPEYSTTVGPIPSGNTLNHNIVLPTMHCIYGEVVDRDGNGLRASYQIAYPGENSRWINTDRNGNFKYYLPIGFEGMVNMSVVTNRSSIFDLMIEVPAGTDVYKHIVMDQQGGGGNPGQPDIIAKCGSNEIYYLTADRPLPTTFGGVIVEPGWLTVISNISDEDESSPFGNDHSFMLQLQGYDPAKSVYDSGFVFAANDGKKAVTCSSGELRITESNGTYYFNLSGDGLYMQANELDEFGLIHEAKITVNNVDISHLMTLERRENYIPANPFPAFTPKLPTPAPVAMVITKSTKVGLGGFLYYNGGKNEFNDLVGQGNASGLDCLGINDSPTSGYSDATFINDKAGILIEADNHAPEITSESWRGKSMFSLMDDGSDDYFESQIYIASVAGGTLPITDFFTEDEDWGTRSLKKCGTLRKHLRKLATRIRR